MKNTLIVIFCFVLFLLYGCTLPNQSSKNLPLDEETFFVENAVFPYPIFNLRTYIDEKQIQIAEVAITASEKEHIKELEINENLDVLIQPVRGNFLTFFYVFITQNNVRQKYIVMVYSTTIYTELHYTYTGDQ